MFPWSDQCLHQRVRRRRRVKEEEEVLDKWTRDVCSGEELPEVEIFSLLEEQIPKYKLRADTLTSFAGYENKDWYIPSPALKPEEIDTPLTPEQIRETLNYFREYFFDIVILSRFFSMTWPVLALEAGIRLGEMLMLSGGGRWNYWFDRFPLGALVRFFSSLKRIS
ncbi:HAP1 N-terminal conserved region [Nesidiocoris tenuis]|uniref:HAP1 N-terminal conserved region n=1 Tax=Nesidiocoris tenuis TaxID=355587 RepID=A0ABN7B175_9HEMI|nr:HAP1 N-terminal conserved region [Nesidiocoris tenuis]